MNFRLDVKIEGIDQDQAKAIARLVHTAVYLAGGAAVGSMVAISYEDVEEQEEDPQLDFTFSVKED